MLLQFSVENFLSFRDRTTLNMLAAEHLQHSPRQVLKGPGNTKVLRAAAIYGANASGKSNLVKALSFALWLIQQGPRSDGKLTRSPFKLDAHTRKSPSLFNFEFGLETTRYSYSFELNDDHILGEWLHFYPSGKEELIFERTSAGASDDTPKSHFQFGDTFIENSDRQAFFRFVAQGTRPNQLFLTAAKEHNGVEFKPIYKAFRQINIMRADARFTQIFDRLPADPDFRAFINQSLRDAGTGLEGLSIEHKDLEVNPDEFGTSESVGDFEDTPERGRLFGDGILVRRIADNKVRLSRLFGIHKDTDDQAVHLTFAEESDGTKRMIHVWPALYLMNKEPSFVCISDELERSLHPLLTQSFLKQFFHICEQQASGQLIFTTHDANLLDLNLLSPDSIWFTEKNKQGATTLYSLSEFNNDQLNELSRHLKDGYLQGRFSAGSEFRGAVFSAQGLASPDPSTKPPSFDASTFTIPSPSSDACCQR